MRHAAISRVYAAALIELAVEKGELEGLVQDLHELQTLVAQTTPFTRLFESPELGIDQKRRVLERVTSGARSALTLRFLLLLVQKHREPMLGPIIAMFDHLCDERAGRLRGRLRSARPLGREQVAEIERKLGRPLNKDVTLSVDTDAGLIAGMVLHLEDRSIDGSLKARLNRMRENLLTAELGKA